MMSDGACQRERVTEIRLERSCQSDPVKVIISESTVDRMGQRASRSTSQRVCHSALQSYCQREPVREHNRDSVSVSSCKSG